MKNISAKKNFTDTETAAEANRLFDKLKRVGFEMKMCKAVAPLTLSIGELKKQRDAVILAHSYQTPDIIYGVADFTGDSYQLSKKAQEVSAGTIVFCGVRFMAETAKILNPSKTVFLPDESAGCSLAEAITAEDVRKLKKKFPGRPVVCYVNTSAEVKAESDVCCTSANALKIVNALPDREIIFLPDELMAQNLQQMTKKKLISWHGRCIVHEDFKAEKVERFRAKYPGLKILAHTECDSGVVNASDFSGGTGDMIRYVQETEAPAYMLITECGLTERMLVEFPEKEFLGMCGLCPYMKQITLPKILRTLKDRPKDQIIEIPENIRRRAEKALLKMFELTKK
jgi:quinolinate synthase